MADGRRFALATVALGTAALVHATFTWPPRATIAFFVGGGLVAFAAEAVAVGAGLLDHRIGPAVVGVPLYVLAGWTGVVYVCLRLALLVTGGVTAVALAAVLAAAFDGLTDHVGVERGYWHYIDALSGPRYRGVPWWNVAGWLAVGAVTAGLALPFL